MKFKKKGLSYKKILILFILIFLVLILFGCQNKDKTEGLKYQINQTNIGKNKINIENSENNKDKAVFYTPNIKECGYICEKIDKSKIFKNVKFEEKVLKKPIKEYENAYPLILINKENLTGLNNILNNIVGRKLPNFKKLSKKEIKKFLEKFSIKEYKNSYILYIGTYAIGKENYCNDGIDNDGDGLIDNQDKQDCGNLYIYYDNEIINNKKNFSKPYQMEGINQYLKLVFPIGFKYNIIYYSNNKQLYVNLLTKYKKNIYLPIFFLDNIPKGYYSKYLDYILKGFGKEKGKINKEIKYDYIKILIKGWDPIKKEVNINFFNNNGFLTNEEIIFFNKEGKTSNPKSDVGMIIWDSPKCPYCKRLIQDLINSKIYNKLNKLSIEEFPTPSIHGKIDNDISILEHCYKNIVKDQIDINSYLMFYNKIHGSNGNDYNEYIKNIQDKKIYKKTKICFDTKYDKILKKINKNKASFGERFKIDGTPTIILYNIKNGFYGTISGYPSLEILLGAIEKINFKKK